MPLGEGIYVYAALRAMIRWRDADWRVEIDGEEHGFTGYSVAVANTGVFGGGMFLVPDASVDDGLLDVALLRHCSKPRYLARRLAGEDAVSAAVFGNRVAARVIQHPGAIIPIEVMRDLV